MMESPPSDSTIPLQITLVSVRISESVTTSGVPGSFCGFSQETAIINAIRSVNPIVIQLCFPIAYNILSAYRPFGSYRWTKIQKFWIGQGKKRQILRKSATNVILLGKVLLLLQQQNRFQIMNATIDISYNQLLLLLQQMPVRAQLRLGKALTNQSIRAELDYFLDVFRTNEISEEDILAEVKAVRHERYALCS